MTKAAFDKIAEGLGEVLEMAPKKRNAPIHREWCLQAGVRRFVERAVSAPHEFAAHDRHAPRGRFSHMYEKGRGVRKGWPDTELVLPEFTFRCELKWPPNRPDADQIILIAKLNVVPAQRCTWADSVACYAENASVKGVPLHPNWRVIAEHEDELVAAEIRKQEAKAGKAPRKRAAERPTASRVAKVNRIRGKVLF